jgi:hypothetical protein
VLDYLGYRLVCMALLPIGGATLRYGSADGGMFLFVVVCFLVCLRVCDVVNCVGRTVLRCHDGIAEAAARVARALHVSRVL